jgi:hypothetical protein
MFLQSLCCSLLISFKQANMASYSGECFCGAVGITVTGMDQYYLRSAFDGANSYACALSHEPDPCTLISGRLVPQFALTHLRSLAYKCLCYTRHQQALRWLRSSATASSADATTPTAWCTMCYSLTSTLSTLRKTRHYRSRRAKTI